MPASGVPADDQPGDAAVAVGVRFPHVAAAVIVRGPAAAVAGHARPKVVEFVLAVAAGLGRAADAGYVRGRVAAAAVVAAVDQVGDGRLALLSARSL